MKKLKNKLDLSPKSRSKRNGGECNGERVDVIAPGDVSDRQSTNDDTGDCKGNSVIHHIRQDIYLDEQQRQKGQQQDLNNVSETAASNGISNDNNESINVVDGIDETYRRSKYSAESSSTSAFPNRTSTSYEHNDCSYSRTPQVQLQSSVSSDHLSPRGFIHHNTPHILSQRFPPNAVPSLNITESLVNHIVASSPIVITNSGNSETLFQNPSNNLATVDENIAERNESNDLASGRSSVGPLIIAEEDCSSTTPNTVFCSEERTIRQQESTLDSQQIPTQFVGNIANNTSINSIERSSVSYERKRTFNDISMDRYSGPTPVTQSRHRSPPSSSPHTSSRSQPHSRGSTTHSPHAMQPPLDIPPRPISPPPAIHLPPPPPLSHRSSISTILSPSTERGYCTEPERGRSHSRPNSWSNPGRSRLEIRIFVKKISML